MTSLIVPNTAVPAVRDPFKERRPPWSEEAEQAVLGAMLLDADAVMRAAEHVDDTMFYREGHRRIFQGVSDLFQVGEPIEPITVIEQLTKSGDLEMAGGRDAVLDLMATPYIAASYRTYAELVRDAATQREIRGRAVAADGAVLDRHHAEVIVDATALPC